LPTDDSIVQRFGRIFRKKKAPNCGTLFRTVGSRLSRLPKTLLLSRAGGGWRSGGEMKSPAREDAHGLDRRLCGSKNHEPPLLRRLTCAKGARRRKTIRSGRREFKRRRAGTSEKENMCSCWEVSSLAGGGKFVAHLHPVGGCGLSEIRRPHCGAPRRSRRAIFRRL